MSESLVNHLRPDFTGATLASSIAARLRTAIMDGELPPGARLRLEDLRAKYEVSLSPLREALSRLSMDGLVEAEEQKGYRVAPVSVDNYAEITLLRIQLETLALVRSIELGDDAWESALVGALHRLHKQELQRTEDSPIEGWELVHREFHNALIAASRMPMLLKMCATLHDLSDRYRRILLRSRPFDRDVGDEHQLIMEAALARNADKAARLLQQHVERTTANVRAMLVKRMEEGAAPEEAGDPAGKRAGRQRRA